MNTNKKMDELEEEMDKLMEDVENVISDVSKRDRHMRLFYSHFIQHIDNEVDSPSIYALNDPTTGRDDREMVPRFQLLTELVPEPNDHNEAYKIAEWYSELDSVSVALWLGYINEDEVWGVDVNTDGGLYHAHAASTLEGGMKAAEVCMFMYAHTHSETEAAEAYDYESR